MSCGHLSFALWEGHHGLFAQARIPANRAALSLTDMRHEVGACGEAGAHVNRVLFSTMFDSPLRPLALAALCCAAVLSASPATAQVADDQRIVITAARAEQPLADALPSTRVITRADIDAAAASDLPGLLRSLTSIDVAQTGPLGSQASLFLRGADSRQTLVLVDGVPLVRADFGTASWQHLPLDQIERIEIVRGNLAALYGAQAVGGVVQIVTRRAGTPEFTLALGSQGTRQAAAAAGTQFGEDSTRTRLSASLSWRRSDGFSARDPRVDPGANPDRDGAQQGSASARVEQTWAPGQRTELSLLSTHTRSDYDGYTPGLSDRLSTQVEKWGVVSRHALGRETALRIELGQSAERFDDPTGFAPNGHNRVRQGVVEWDWQLAPAHSLQAALETRRERFEDSTTPLHDRKTDSVRLAWLGRPSAAWQVQAALRSDDSSDFGRATTGLLALAWLPAPGWKFSAQAATGFSAPSFVDMQYANPAVPLKPERSRQGELAVQWTEGAAQARLALFKQRQRDRIDFDPVTFEAGNIARARNQGLEAMLQWPIGAALLGADLTLQDPRNDLTDRPLKRRSKQSLALNATLPLAGWRLGVALRHTGQRLDTDPVTFADAMNGARNTLDLHASYALSAQWRVAAKVENATAAHTSDVLGYTAPPRSVLLTLQGALR